MSKQYQHRVSVRAEICFDLILDSSIPTSQELRDAVVNLLNKSTDDERGFALPALPEGKVFPDWTSVDPEIEPHNVLAPDAIRSLDCFEIGNVRDA